jgi:hypothetical protein
MLYKILLGSMLAYSTIHAGLVSENDAKNIALNKAYQKSGKTFRVKKIVKDKTLLKKASKYTKYLDNNSKIRLIKLEPKGWVLVSGDDQATPVIGYSLKSEFDENDLPPQLEGLLGELSKSLDNLKKKDKSSKTIDITNHEYLQLLKEREEKWKKLNQEHTKYKVKHPVKKEESLIDASYDGVSYSFASPTLKLEKETEVITPLWAQGKFYNQYAPEIPADTSDYAIYFLKNEGRSPTGCVATAMAEIMRYHTWPEKATFSKEYYDDVKGAMQQRISLYNSNRVYDWDNMNSEDLNASNNEITTLMNHAAVSVLMNFEAVASGASMSRARYKMESNFGYQSLGYQKRSKYGSIEEWRSMIYTDLRQGYPVLYSGANEDGLGSHAFILDGFDTEGSEYHVNFGWGGGANGYYSLDNLTPIVGDFSYKQFAIFSLKPNNSEHRDVYEKDNSWDKSSYIIIGKTQEKHNIAPAGDEDWITFWNGVNDRNLTIQINSNIAGYKDTQLFLYDYFGNLIAHNDNDTGVLSKIVVDSLLAGRYYIQVQAADSTKEIASYDLQLIGDDIYEKDDHRDEASQLYVGNSQENHSIAPAGDEDWIKFWNGGENNITIQTHANANTVGNSDSQLFLYDINGTQVAYNDDYGDSDLSKIIVNNLSEGIYLIKVQAYSNTQEISSYDISIKKD